MENRQLSFFDLYEHPFISSIFNSLPESESDEIEYKSAEGGFPDEFWKTYSAFANSKGGIIVLGVKERKNEIILEGLALNKIATYKKAFWDNANNPQKVSINLFSDKDLIELHSLRKLFGEKVDALGKDELNILAICQIEGEVNNNRLQDSINKHRTDITKILQELCKDGYLQSENKSRWTTYHLNTNLSLFENLDEFSSIATSESNVASSFPNVDTSSSNVDTSVSNVDTSGSNVDTSTLKQKKTKLQKNELEMAILDLCQLEYKSLEEIGRSINKAPKYLNNNIISPMIESGKLVRLHPKINHPNQAYKAVAKE